MTDPRDASRERFLESLARCMQHQDPAIILPPALRASDEGWSNHEFIPEEPMGNGEPLVHCDIKSPSAIGEGGWA